MERPEIEDYNTGSYDGLLGYCRDLDRYLDYLELEKQK
jgi:hypothetical protein